MEYVILLSVDAASEFALGLPLGVRVGLVLLLINDG